MVAVATAFMCVAHDMVPFFFAFLCFVYKRRKSDTCFEDGVVSQYARSTQK